MNVFKKAILIILVILIVIQFFHPSKNIAAGKSSQSIASIYSVPANVHSILSKACNDCHSNNTRYPWYNNIQPVAWWLDNHIRDGKRGLNFDEFATYRIGKQYHRMEDIIDEVKKGDMPLGSYTLIHTNANLNDDEKNTIYKWAGGIRDSIKARYPADSLVKKR